ncbi:MAG: ABC transporter ATP-binding protein [Chloroherpetonaceae bacterium]|nr:ABC transporter ATP-binding protein [Chloroherpetonaceae bacterium]
MVNAIEINSVTKSFGAITALKAISLSVKKGEMHALLGPDGAGKTTLIRMLCGIQKPDNGKLTVLGVDSGSEELKSKIGYLSQRFSLYQDLSIDENIAFFAEIHQVKNYRERRDSLLEFTRLLHFRERLAGALSGGMKQKLALACTLIHTPEIIFLDEPTTGVDPVTRRDFWALLSNLLKSGVTILVSTPYLDEAERCSRISMLNQGELIASGTATELQEKYGETTFEVILQNPRATSEKLKTVPRFQAALSDSVVFGERIEFIFHTLSEQDALQLIQETFAAVGIAPEHCRKKKSSLEHIFIQLVKVSEKMNAEAKGAERKESEQ